MSFGKIFLFARGRIVTRDWISIITGHLGSINNMSKEQYSLSLSWFSDSFILDPDGRAHSVLFLLFSCSFQQFYFYRGSFPQVFRIYTRIVVVYYPWNYRFVLTNIYRYCQSKIIEKILYTEVNSNNIICYV